jgi:hypothetical protein
MAAHDDLKFPVIKGDPLPPSDRTMDEINAWIEENYELFFDRETYEREKSELSVNIPFRL